MLLEEVTIKFVWSLILYT